MSIPTAPPRGVARFPDGVRAPDRTLLVALGAGVVTEVALVVGLAWPLWIGRAPDAITDWEPLSRMIGSSPVGLARFLATLVLWLGGYAVVLVLSRRSLTAPARATLALFPVLFALTLLPTWPAASKDIYHYVMEGRTLVVHGENPLLIAPDALPEDPLSWILSSWADEPSRYGPLWALLTAVPVRVAEESLRGTVLLFKALSIAAYLLIALITYLTARRVRMEMALPAYVFVAWNPLLIFEAAHNGHNDLVMLAFTALALYLAARRRWLLVFPALAAAALVKYVTGLLGPLLLLWAWRSRRRGDERRWRIVAGLVLGLLLTVATYAPFWAGWETFAALRSASGEALSSPGWLLREGLERAGMAGDTARLFVSIPLTLAFLAAYALALRLVWRGANDLNTLWRAGLLVLAVYSCTVAWWFWPWYICWSLLPVALLVRERGALFAALWSAAALAAYVPITYRPLFWGEVPDDRMPLAIALTVFLPAAVAAAYLFPRRRLQQLDEGGPSR